MKALFTVPGQAAASSSFAIFRNPRPEQARCSSKCARPATNRGELLARPLLRSDNPALRPMRSGGEFAGEVAALGDGVMGMAVGARVMGRAVGSYAEFTIANQRALMRIPDGHGMG